MTKFFTANRAIIGLLASVLVAVASKYFEVEIGEDFAFQFVEFVLQVTASSYAMICIYLESRKNV